MALGTGPGITRMVVQMPDFSASLQAMQQERRTKQIVTGVIGTGGGAVAGMLVGPRLGVDKKIGAMVGAGAGLLGALLVLRWT